MFRSITMFTFGLSLVAGLVFAQSAAAEQILPAIGSGEGEVKILACDCDPDDGTATGDGVQTFEADAVGSVIGEHKTEGTTFFNLFTGDVLGSFEATAKDGSTISGEFEGVFFPLDDAGTIGFALTVTWTGGTGQFTGVSGSADLDAIQFVDPETGDILTSYMYDGEFILP